MGSLDCWILLLLFALASFHMLWWKDSNCQVPSQDFTASMSNLRPRIPMGGCRCVFFPPQDTLRWPLTYFSRPLRYFSMNKAGRIVSVSRIWCQELEECNLSIGIGRVWISGCHTVSGWQQQISAKVLQFLCKMGNHLSDGARALLGHVSQCHVWPHLQILSVK